MTGTPSRMLALLSLLQVSRDWSGSVLAERLGVTTRTVRRDVERLRELGYRIRAVKGPDGGYRLEAGAELPPLRFDDEQAVAIAIALRSAPSLGVEMDEAAERALATVRQVMPSRLRHRLDGVQFASSAAPVRVVPEVLETVGVAVTQRMTLRMDYGEATDGTRRVQPHGLVARGGLWYLVAWDLDRDDWRIFRLDRVRARAPSGPRFDPRPIPTGDPGTFLAVRLKGASDQDRWPCIGEVELELPAGEVAQWVNDGEVEALTPHTARVKLGSWSWAGLLAAVLRFDADFRIIGPDELITAAGDLEQRLHRARQPHGSEDR
ncbi:MAG: WYL domain-containing protein [Kocuria sp.]|nr:WYL domain-containing protein [Kocuria sp.]MDN5655285.1 WYL domain-containing protein [Kocuria sp.]